MHDPHPNNVRFYFPATDSELWANSTLLSKVSPYFKALLSSAFAESQLKSASTATVAGKSDGKRKHSSIEGEDDLSDSDSDSDSETDLRALPLAVVRPSSTTPARGEFHEIVIEGLRTRHTQPSCTIYSPQPSLSPRSAPPPASPEPPSSKNPRPLPPPCIPEIRLRPRTLALPRRPQKPRAGRVPEGPPRAERSAGVGQRLCEAVPGCPGGHPRVLRCELGRGENSGSVTAGFLNITLHVHPPHLFIHSQVPPSCTSSMYIVLNRRLRHDPPFLLAASPCHTGPTLHRVHQGIIPSTGKLPFAAWTVSIHTLRLAEILLCDFVRPVLNPSAACLDGRPLHLPWIYLTSRSSLGAVDQNNAFNLSQIGTHLVHDTRAGGRCAASLWHPGGFLGRSESAEW